MQPKVSVIVLNYNGIKFIKQCLDTVEKLSYKNLETVVVDNASTDESIKYLRSLSWIKLVENKVGLGYAGGMNVGAKNASGDFLLILTNDTKVPKDFVENLLKCWQEKSIVIPRQVTMGDPKSEGFAGNGMDVFGYPYGGYNWRDTKVFYADGASFFIKKRDFKKLGMFDAPLFLFQEDVDLSWRAQLAGYSIVPCMAATFEHHSGGTLVGGIRRKSKKHVTSYVRRYFVERNTLRNIIKNYSLSFLIPVLIVSTFLNLLQMLAFLLLGERKLVKSFVDAYVWNIQNLKGSLKWRKKVQKMRKVSDLKLLGRMYFGYSKLTAFLRTGGLPEFK